MRIFLAVCVLLFATPVFAIDFTQTLTDLKGEAIIEKGGDGKELPVTLGAIATGALFVGHPDDARDTSGSDKSKRFNIALKINGKDGQPQKDVLLSADEVSMIVKLIKRTYATLYVGRALQLLDPEALK